MKIAYYSVGFSQDGGSGTHAHGLATAWERAGHAVLRLQGLFSGVAAPSASRGTSVGSASLARQLARDVRGRLRARAHVGRLRASLASFAPDVLVARRGLYDFTLDALTARAGLPWIAEFNGLGSIEQTALLGSRPLPWEVAREGRFMRGAALVAAITDEARAQVLAIGGDPRKVVTIHNGTDLDVFRPGLEGEDSVREWARRWSPIIAFCGTGTYTFDRETVGAAMSRVAAELPGAGFLFVGLDEVAVLASCPAAESFRGRLSCTGRVPNRDVPGRLAAADVFWAAYRNDYGSPLKQFEYMAMGKPVAIAGDGQARWLVDEAQCGRAVHRKDARGLAQAVLSIWAQTPAEREALGAHGRQWVQDNASWDAVARRILDAYKAAGAQSAPGVTPRL